MKAHREEEDALNDADLLDIRGNKAADWLAGPGARKHDFDQSTVDQLKEAIKMYRGLFWGMGKILSLWGPTAELFDISKGFVRARVGRRQLNPHVPRWHIDHYRCACCLRKISALTKTPCQALHPSLLSVLRGSRL